MLQLVLKDKPGSKRISALTAVPEFKISEKNALFAIIRGLFAQIAKIWVQYVIHKSGKRINI
jgi:hypothetical protein